MAIRNWKDIPLFKDVTDEQWNDWHWQVEHRLSTVEDIAQVVNLTEQERADIEKVMGILDSFVTRGNTVIVIEHNTDVMKLADYIIDVGPDGGSRGGEIVFVPNIRISETVRVTEGTERILYLLYKDKLSK